MIEFLEKNKTFEYVLKEERPLPKSEQTVFVFKYMSKRDLTPFLYAKGDLKFLLEKTLIKIKNGKETMTDIEDAVERIPNNYVGELANYVLEFNQMTMPEKKS